MQLTQLVQIPELRLEVKAGQKQLDRVVKGAYASDLLSHVMARAKEGNIWVTIQAHQNIVAVAALLNLAGIVIAGGIEPQADTLLKAEEEGIPILTTSLAAFEVIGRLYALGVGADHGQAELAQS
ncbi:MAG: DRTGG domain-containing protein [bacterium]|jgi:predicted transcriptional regulator|nr:serine kinase [Bacillota bacterium]